MPAIKYKLITAEYPKVEKNKVIDDLGLGGIKLTYAVSKNRGNVTAKDKKVVVFLKPLKKHWALDKKDCARGQWGPSNSPYMNIWLQLEPDAQYTNFKEERMFIRFIDNAPIKNPELIGLLNKVDTLKEFIIGTDEPISHITLKDRLWYLFHLYNPFGKK